MAESRQTVSLVLREPEHQIFDCRGDEIRRANEFVFELSARPCIAVEVRVKVPGPSFEVTRAPLTVDLERATGERGLGPYERLLHL